MNFKFAKPAAPLVVLTVLGLTAVSQANADTLPICPDIACDSKKVHGSFSQNFDINLTSGGLMTVSLQDAAQILPSFAPLSSLSFMVASGTNMVWSSVNATSNTFTLPAGSYSGLLNASMNNPDPHIFGVYSLSVKFLATPIPAGLWLLLSGALGLAAVTRGFNKAGRITLPEAGSAVAA